MKVDRMGKYPVIDIYRTGQKIKQIMLWRGMKVRDIQEYLDLATPQSIYHWFNGRNMPTTDNLYALSDLFHIPVDEMICGDRKAEFYFDCNSTYGRLYTYYVKFQNWKVG